MEVQRYQARILLLRTGFRDPDRRLFFRRARLYPDRIELSGWTPARRFREEISLGDVRRVLWNPDASDEPNAMFYLMDGGERPIHFQSVLHWKHMLDDCLLRQGNRPHRSTADVSLQDLALYGAGMS
jgi:hypothetical protein